MSEANPSDHPKMLRCARFTIYRVLSGTAPADHRPHTSTTHSGCVFAASFSQFATEFCT